MQTKHDFLICYLSPDARVIDRLVYRGTDATATARTNRLRGLSERVKIYAMAGSAIGRIVHDSAAQTLLAKQAS